jgi:hypothetical protein
MLPARNELKIHFDGDRLARQTEFFDERSDRA